MLNAVVETLKEGIDLENLRIHGKSFKKGRMAHHEYFFLTVETDEESKRLMRVSLYHGDPPHYHPWIELFGITPELTIGDKKIDFFDSELEDAILDLFSRPLGKGGRIFIEYYDDPETRNMLSVGVPKSCTRLGFKLFERGVTWFKDWYFAEGFREGGQKLQAEKPIDKEHRKKHLRSIKRNAMDFLKRKEENKDKFNKRARSLINQLDVDGE